MCMDSPIKHLHDMVDALLSHAYFNGIMLSSLTRRNEALFMLHADIVLIEMKPC